MAKPLVNNVKRGKLVEKGGGVWAMKSSCSTIYHTILPILQSLAKSNKGHGSRITKQVGQVVKVPRIKGADKIISILCEEHEAEDQKIKNRQSLS